MASKRRVKEKSDKRARKAHRMSHPGAKSPYAKKEAYLNTHGGWGFDYPEPKPWK